MRAHALVLAIALAAGCLEPAGGHEWQGVAQDAADGVELTVAWRMCDASYCVDAVARNNGPEPITVAAGCLSPWMESIVQGDDVVRLRGHLPCFGTGTHEVPPGASMWRNMTWDGRERDPPADGRPWDAAPEGPYLWRIQFLWGGEGIEHRGHALAVQIPLAIQPK